MKFRGQFCCLGLLNQKHMVPLASAEAPFTACMPIPN